MKLWTVDQDVCCFGDGQPPKFVYLNGQLSGREGLLGLLLGHGEVGDLLTYGLVLGYQPVLPVRDGSQTVLRISHL